MLKKVEEPSIVHDILWQFNCALASHPVQQMATRMKAEREKEEKEQKNEKVTASLTLTMHAHHSPTLTTPHSPLTLTLTTLPSLLSQRTGLSASTH